MSDATPALVFLLMLIAPCAIALMGDRHKAKEAAAPVEPESKSKSQAKPQTKSQPKLPAAPTKASSASIPVFTPPPIVKVQAAPVAVAHAQPPRLYTQGPDPYAQAARLYSQPSSSFVEPYLPKQQPPPPTPLTPAAERAQAEALLAQAAAAKAHAAALAAAARTAQAKANHAAELANQAARAAQDAHRAAAYERDVQAQITAQEQARTASGEHALPDSHPSLDFPRSGRSRRAA